jgi:hypothetical protein
MVNLTGTIEGKSPDYKQGRLFHKDKYLATPSPEIAAKFWHDSINS